VTVNDNQLATHWAGQTRHSDSKIQVQHLERRGAATTCAVREMAAPRLRAVSFSNPEPC
jgi:hypothetical protein